MDDLKAMGELVQCAWCHAYSDEQGARLVPHPMKGDVRYQCQDCASCDLCPMCGTFLLHEAGVSEERLYEALRCPQGCDLWELA